MKLQLKRSSMLDLGAAKEPTVEQMEYGELAVNYSNGDPAIFLKDNSNNIIRIAGVGNINSGNTPSGDTLPPTGNQVGDTFFNTGDNTLYYFDGSVWVPIANDVTAADIYVGTLAEINADAPAADRRNGFLWWNTEDGTLYIWYIDANTSQFVIAIPSSGGGGGASVVVNNIPPSDTDQGDMWWNTTDGRLYIWYQDDDTEQWVDASPDSQVNPITSGENFPTTGFENDMFFNTTDGRLYIYYNDGSSLQWVDASPDSQTAPYWDRNGTTLKPANAGDNIEAAAGTFSGDVSVNNGATIYAQNSNILSQAVPDSTREGYSLTNGPNNNGAVALRLNYHFLSGASPFAINLVNTNAGTENTMYEIDNNGNHYIGGQIPSSANITLYADGVGKFGQNGGSASEAKNGLLVRGDVGMLSIFKAIGLGTGNNYINCSREPSETDFRVTATGTIQATNQTVQPITSERRLKENIVAIDPVKAWETIKSTPHYSYNFIGNPSNSYGPMADEVPTEMVVQPMEENEAGVMVARSDEEGPIRTYDNGMLQARLYTALQTALTRIEALEAKVQSLEGGN